MIIVLALSILFAIASAFFFLTRREVLFSLCVACSFFLSWSMMA